MKIWNVPPLALHEIVRHVSDQNYRGNIIFKRHPEPDGKACIFTLTVRDSTGPGSRVSASGRRVAAACWHAHRDIMAAIFNRYPDARLKTALADYRGQSAFNMRFPATGYTNIGSAFNPVHLHRACNCARQPLRGMPDD